MDLAGSRAVQPGGPRGPARPARRARSPCTRRIRPGAGAPRDRVKGMQPHRVGVVGVCLPRLAGGGLLELEAGGSEVPRSHTIAPRKDSQHRTDPLPALETGAQRLEHLGNPAQVRSRDVVAPRAINVATSSSSRRSVPPAAGTARSHLQGRSLKGRLRLR